MVLYIADVSSHGNIFVDNGELIRVETHKDDSLKYKNKIKKKC